MYNMEDPLTLLDRVPPPKGEYKEYILTKIAAFHERELRLQASKIKSLKYFNLSLLSLRGKPHVSICDVFTSKEVSNMRPHLKFLCGDYLTYQKRARHSGGSPNCRVCESGEPDSYKHIIMSCEALQTPRDIMLSQIIQLCENNNILFIHNILEDEELMTQFIIDPTSHNLPQRVNINDQVLPSLISICRNLCNSLHLLRMKIIKDNNI